MDIENTLHTPGTYRLMRAEHVALLVLCLAVGLYHWELVRWGRAIAAFWIIDVIGYVPGAIAYRRRGGGPIAPLYHHVYNFAHTYLVAGSGVGLWALAIGGFEWAMLAVPVHLSIDRGIFGNVFKPLLLPFEPVAVEPDILAEAVGRKSVAEAVAPEEARRNAPDVVDHPSGFLALNEANRLFTLPDREGFIAYREKGGHRVVFGGVFAPARDAAALLDGFIDAAERRGRRVLAVQVREKQVEMFTDRGFTVNPFGTSFGLALEGFTLAGKKKMKLRNKIHRAERSGLRVAELGRELARTETSFEKIREVSAEWVADKGAKELDFMIGEIGRPEENDRRIFVALDGNDAAVAFISYVPVWGERPGVLHDLTRKKPMAPAGTMELLNAFAIERFQSEGIAFLHFGFTPFILNGHAPSTASRVVDWTLRQLREHGSALYPADSQAAYKLKWEPGVVEQEYIAVRPLSLRAVVDLLLVTRTV